ncbi:MAG: zinc-ribbon domain-containing protein [Lachnospiraceae bacterium]|nr:zinc-ribbon domain-containing protein [Lachnospiraceae bacterium]
MFCTNCGAKVEDGALFCTNCGAKLEPAENTVSKVAAEDTGINTDAPVVEEPVAAEPLPVSEPQPVSKPQPISEPQPVNEPQPVPASVPSSTSDSGNNGNKKTGILIGIIVGAVVLIAAIVCLCIFILGNNDSKSSKKNKAETEESDDKEDKKKDKKKDKDKDKDDSDDDSDDKDKSSKKKKKDKDADNKEKKDPDTVVSGELLELDSSYKKFSDLIAVSSDEKEELSLFTNDYSVINWTEEYDIAGSGLVLSLASFEYYDSPMYVYCISNTRAETLDFYGDITALNSSKSSVGDGYASTEQLCYGSSFVGTIPCTGDVDDFEIDFSVRLADGTEEGHWEADWALDTKSSYSPVFKYDMFNYTDITYSVGYLYVFPVDENGNVLGYGYDYPSLMIKPDQDTEGELSVYTDDVASIKTVAMFATTKNLSDDDLYVDENGNGYFESENGDLLYIRDNGDGTCGVYLKIKGSKKEYEYIDPASNMTADSLNLYDHSSGDMIGTVYFYQENCYAYIYEPGNDEIEQDADFYFTKTEYNENDIKTYSKAIDKKK